MQEATRRRLDTTKKTHKQVEDLIISQYGQCKKEAKEVKVVEIKS